MAEITILIQTARTLGFDQTHRIIEEMDALSHSERSAVIANLLTVVKIAELSHYHPQHIPPEVVAADSA